MIAYDFYEIKSKKSTELINGVYQITLSCSNYSGTQCFLWINPNGDAQHIQLIFDEKIVEWFPNQGLVLSCTNRRQQSVSQRGVMKGVRTIHQSKDLAILQEGLSLVSSANFPSKWDQLIKEKFCKKADLT